jgi:glycosyltransferase involved in cell wall biosynthesis
MTEGLGVSSVNLDEIAYDEISDPAVMAKHPLVSVCMMTYNHEPYIAQAIEGVLMQEADFPIELVIGEDCSTDRTREIVLEYQREHPDVIRVVLWDRNVGARRNYQKLDDLLRGRYVAFNEGDDCWTHPKKLQMQVDIMEANPDVGLVHGGADDYDVNRKRRRRWKPRPSDYDDGDVFVRLLRYDYHVCAPTVCARADLVRAVQRSNPDLFDGRYLMGDMPLYYELSRITGFKLINETLVTYNVLPESASRSRDTQKLIRFWKSGLELRLYMCRKYACGRAVEDAIILRYHDWLLSVAYVAGMRELAFECARTIRGIRGRLTVVERLHLLGTVNPCTRSAARLGRRLFAVLPDSVKGLLGNSR